MTGITLKGASDPSRKGAPRDDGRPSSPGHLHLVHMASQMLARLSKAVADGHTSPLKITFGRTSILHLGPHQGEVHLTVDNFWHESYRANESSSSELDFAGMVSHDARVGGLKRDNLLADAATAELQVQLAALEKEKQSLRTEFRPDLIFPVRKPGSSKKAPVPTGKGKVGEREKRERAEDKAKGQGNLTEGQKFLRKQRDILVKRRQEVKASYSAMAASRGPAAGKGPSALPAKPELPAYFAGPMDERAVRMHAVRTNLVHLLAIGPTTVTAISRKIAATEAECQEVLVKHGVQRGPAGEWGLSDRGFKLLDVWKFPYVEARDREGAISNAVSAYDRLRLSRSDDLWQQLLPVAERGKGKILSRLNLHHGPIVRAAVPEAVARKTSAGPAETKTAAKKSSAATAAASKRGREVPSTSARGAVSKKEPGRTTSTPTKANKKATTAAGGPNGPFKSSEFVEESDEEEDVAGAPAEEYRDAIVVKHGRRETLTPTPGPRRISATTIAPVASRSVGVTETTRRKTTGGASAPAPAPAMAATAGTVAVKPTGSKRKSDEVDKADDQEEEEGEILSDAAPATVNPSSSSSSSASSSSHRSKRARHSSSSSPPPTPFDYPEFNTATYPAFEQTVVAKTKLFTEQYPLYERMKSDFFASSSSSSSSNAHHHAASASAAAADDDDDDDDEKARKKSQYHDKVVTWERLKAWNAELRTLKEEIVRAARFLRD